MNTGVEVALLVPVAYLLGTFPSATLVARRRGVDVTAEGSGNPGASNTFRLLGWKAGALVFAMDVLKGALAALAGLAVDGHRGAYVLGVAAVLGHVRQGSRRRGHRVARVVGGTFVRGRHATERLDGIAGLTPPGRRPRPARGWRPSSA